MPRKKIEETGFLSKSEKTKLQRLYSSGKAAYGSLKNLQKASNLSKSKVEKFLQSKESFTKFRQANRKFDRLSAFAKHINEIWCMNLAFVDKLATLNNGVKYLLVSIDVFSRLAYETKAAYAERAIRSLKNIIYRFMEEHGYKYIHKPVSYTHLTLPTKRNV